MAKAPFIIIGMHRSGTSLLAKVLESAGIFMGVVKDHNYEAMHFLSLNQQSMWAAGFDWHRPGVPVRQHWKNLSPKLLYFEHFKLNGKLARWKLQLQNPHWGWKDPRNTFTLPMWLALFPRARVLHIWRTPDAVVQSLQQRNQRKGEVFRAELQERDFCLQLYRQYLTQARSYASPLGPRYCEVQYEKLKQRDPETLSKLERFTDRSLNAALDKHLR